MTPSPSNWEIARQWLAVIVPAIAAMFAGLIWWMARKRLGTRYRFEIDNLNSFGMLRVKVSVLNRSDRDLTIEGISVKQPFSIVLAQDGSGHISANYAKPESPTAQKVPYRTVVRPDETHGTSLAIQRPGGFESCKRVSIRLHILSSFPVIRHKKKVLTAILPANIRNAQK